MLKSLKLFLDRTQNPAEILLVPSIIIFSIISFIVFRSKQLITLSGDISIGLMILISAGIISLVCFTPFYLYGLKKRSIKLHLGAIIYNSVVLTIAITVTVAMVSFLTIYVFNSSFKNIQLDIFISSAFVGIYAGVLLYLIIPVAINMSTIIVARLFSIVMISGIILSMITNNNANWWQVNFSYLGWGSGISSLSFNLTIIMAGLLIIALSTQFTNDLRRSEHVFDKRDVNLNLLSLMFIVLGIDMSCLVLFPYDRYPAIHDFLGYSMLIIFGVIILSLKYIFPRIDKTFLTNSYLTLALLAFCYILFALVGYIRLTGFELISFVVTFGWLMMFVRKISQMSQLKHP
ncbi:MAG: hypothetical protein NTY56_02565 [Patescibacteria group bacterium]|nr:hypothetical protein [Patescibacteria group bacterium]